MKNIQRSDTHETLVERLTKEAHEDSGKPIFPTMRELMCFAALIGFHGGEKKPLAEKKIELDSRPFFDHDQTVDLMYSIALADRKDPLILREGEEDEVVRIVEGYIEAGFAELQLWMRETPGDPLGDQAILSALHKRGFLAAPKGHDEVSSSVEF